MIENTPPQWFLLTVQRSAVFKIADILRLKGYEPLVPTHTVRRQWSDRVKTYKSPLFPSRMFCKFPPSREHVVNVCETRGVFSIYERAGKPIPIPESEIAAIRLLTTSSYPIEISDLPAVGDVVVVGSNPEVRGVLVERSTVCRVAIGLGSMGQTAVLKVPLDAVKRVEGSLIPHWSLADLTKTTG